MAFFAFLMHMTIDLADRPKLHWTEPYAYAIQKKTLALLEEASEAEWSKVNEDLFKYFDQQDVRFV